MRKLRTKRRLSRRPSQRRDHTRGGESALKIGSVILMIGLALASAQMTASAEPVTSLEAQAMAPGIDPATLQDSSEISADDLARALKPASSSVDTIMRSLGYGGLRDDAEAAASVEAINAGRFQPSAR